MLQRCRALITKVDGMLIELPALVISPLKFVIRHLLAAF
jgi:hypothetical protein